MAGPVSRALTLAAQGHAQEAAAVLRQAGDAGDAVALFTLATWQLGGEALARDLIAARANLRRAVEIGHVDAALMEVALTANGSGGTPDWRRAIDLLDRAAAIDPVAAQQRDLLAAMTLDQEGWPRTAPRKLKIAESPEVWRIDDFVTPQECHHIALSVHDILEPALVVDPATGREIANPVRTSDAAVIGPTRESLPIQAINRRIAAATATDWRQGEALTVLRYGPGQQFRPHVDAIAGARNQRVQTVLIYLNDAFTGGETCFADNGLSVAARPGTAILFDNVRADGSIDPCTRHAGLPVTQGVKWLATRWIRARPFDVWKGPETA